MTQLQGLVRGPKTFQVEGVSRLTFSLLLPEGREVFVQCTPAVNLPVGQQATVFGTFDSEGTLVANLIQASSAPPPPAPVPLPTPAGKGIRWGRMVVWALVADVVAGVFVFGVLQQGRVDRNTLALLFVVFAFFFADGLARLFAGKPPAQRSWVAGVLSMLLPITFAVLQK